MILIFVVVGSELGLKAKMHSFHIDFVYFTELVDLLINQEVGGHRNHFMPRVVMLKEPHQ